MGLLSSIFKKPLRTLELQLVRSEFGNDYTGGILYVDGMRFGDTIEPKDRGLTSDMPLAEIKKQKVYAKTCIPYGRYKLSWQVSPSLKDRSYAKKYDGKFPYLLNVPGWEGVMLHPFNYGTESKGCIAVGEKWMPGKIINATKGYQDLMDFYLVPAFKRNQEVWITIKKK